MPAVLWLHGLGDTGAGWEGAFGALAQKATFHHPDAPIQAVSVQGGAKMTSWFDINTWPISLQEPEGPAGIEATVKAVHQKLDAIVDGGVPSDKILLGGFSQGGTVSMLAALTYPKKLAGIVAISGWGAYRDSLPAKVSDSVNSKTPMLYTVGDGDPIVTFPLTKKTGEVLQSIMGDSVSVVHARRSGHPPGRAEMDSVAKFIASTLEL